MPFSYLCFLIHFAIRLHPIIGYYCVGGNGALPVICPMGSYCPYQSSTPLSCSTGSTTLLNGSSSAIACECSIGYYYNGTTLSNGMKLCSICSGGYYCSGGNSINNRTLCAANTYCPIGSSSPLSCGTRNTLHTSTHT